MTELISGCECDGEVGCSARDCSAKVPDCFHSKACAHVWCGTDVEGEAKCWRCGGRCYRGCAGERYTGNAG